MKKSSDAGTKRMLALSLGVALLVAAGCEKKGQEAAPQAPAGGGTPAAGAGGAGDAPAAAAGAKGKIDPAKATASISGKVSFDGTPPAAAPVNMASKPECKDHANTPSDLLVVASDGGLAHSVVYVKKGLEGYEFDVPSAPAKIDQKGCMYEPHVFGIQVNQDLEIHNSDPFPHNVNVTAINPFNIPFVKDAPAEVKKKWFKREGSVQFKCDIHPWMSAWAWVSKHPYFVITGPDGKFELKGLPAGKYTVAVWHEPYPKLKAATQEFEVEVADGEAKTQDFSFAIK